MRNNYLFVLLILIVVLVYHRWTSERQKFYPGESAPAAPVQRPLLGAKPFAYKKYTLKP